MRRFTKLRRRRFLQLAAGAAALPAASQIAKAQDYPARPVHLVVGFSAGGPFDITARLIGQWLSERLGQPFIVENRPGAGANIATAAVVSARRRWLHAPACRPAERDLNATLYDNLSFEFIRDIAPVAAYCARASTYAGQFVFCGQNRSRIHCLCEGQSGQDRHGIGRQWQLFHMSGELFQIMTGIDLVHVPYKGAAPALTDLLRRAGATLLQRIIQGRSATSGPASCARIGE